MKDRGTSVAGVLGILMWIGFTAAHIYTAVVVYKAVKLWAFLTILLVPGIGDLMGIYVLFKIKFFFPLIVYAIDVAIFILIALVGDKIDKKSKQAIGKADEKIEREREPSQL